MAEEMLKVYLGLVHYPIVNKHNEIVTTAVTNMDIHDISRTCRTFGISRYFIITPMKPQQNLIKRIVGYWKTDEANLYNPDRQDALSVSRVVDSIEEAKQKIFEKEGVHPIVCITSARNLDENVKVSELIEHLRLDRRPLLLLFGTGHGLASEVVKNADFRLTPIVGSSQDGYNHLSVRSAVAIYCEKFRSEEKR